MEEWKGNGEPRTVSWKKKLWLALVVVCAAVLIGSAVNIWRTVRQSRHENDTFLELARMVDRTSAELGDMEAGTEVGAGVGAGADGGNGTGASGEGAKTSQTSARQSRYARIAAENPDFAGWLKIDQTVIDYPVMHTPDDIQYYIRRDFYGEESVSGTPFIGDNCSVDSLGMIIYGHNMKNDTMFGALDLYADESYWREHPVIRFNTLEEDREYEVFAAFRTKLLYENEEGFRYYEYVGNPSKEEFQEFVEQAKAVSYYDTGITPLYGDQFLILSTCSYHTSNGRFVVVARKR